MTDYWLDGPGANPGGGRDFPPVQTSPGPTLSPIKWVPGLSRGVKCGRGVLLTTHLLLVPRSWKSRATYTSIRPLGRTGLVTGSLYLFLYFNKKDVTLVPCVFRWDVGYGEVFGIIQPQVVL